MKNNRNTVLAEDQGLETVVINNDITTLRKHIGQKAVVEYNKSGHHNSVSYSGVFLELGLKSNDGPYLALDVEKFNGKGTRLSRKRFYFLGKWGGIQNITVDYEEVYTRPEVAPLYAQGWPTDNKLRGLRRQYFGNVK